MKDLNFAGAVLRMLRLERQWSQDTLCQGICNVSYLSKIEQGRVQPNEELLKALFSRLEIPWQKTTEGQGRGICEKLYELVFADEEEEIQQSKELGILRQESAAMGLYYLDYLILRTYCCKEKNLIPENLIALLDNRQKSLLYLAQNSTHEALQCYPCALTVKKAGEEAYRSRNYTRALELLQQGYDMASQQGYARIMLFCRLYMANCCSEMQNVPNMLTHYTVAKRLARALGELKLLKTIEYNIASTYVECGYYQEGYDYYSSLEKLSVLDAHKLAICCEKLNRPVEALTMLNIVRDEAQGIQAKMCDLVRFRLKNKYYLQEHEYGTLLLETFQEIRRTMPLGFARFHLPWVEEWYTANRQYRAAYELIREFSSLREN